MSSLVFIFRGEFLTKFQKKKKKWGTLHECGPIYTDCSQFLISFSSVPPPTFLPLLFPFPPIIHILSCDSPPVVHLMHGALPPADYLRTLTELVRFNDGLCTRAIMTSHPAPYIPTPMHSHPRPRILSAVLAYYEVTSG